MALEYSNRKGDVYYLQEGKTKTGKPKYYFGRKLNGKSADVIPAGFEIRENPIDGVVTLRKIKPTEISSLEKNIVTKGLQKYSKIKHFIVDVDGNNLVVYLPGTADNEAESLISRICGPWNPTSIVQNVKDLIVSVSTYSPMLRFELVDQEERLFCTLRWCYMGSIDDWMYLSSPEPLAELLKEYAPHLGKESFFELI